MDEDDFRAVEAQLAVLAAAIGAPPVMDVRNYRVPIERGAPRDKDGRADRPMPIRERVVAEIKALERHVALLDYKTYKNAMGRIDFVLRAGSDRALRPTIPEEAVIQLDSPSGEPGETLRLATLPDLRAVREALLVLAESLNEED